jgi:8-amino-7-oxononanoate synthase
VRFVEHIADRLRDIEAAGLLRLPRRIGSPQGPTARVDGREVVLLCSNNYLGLAAHPELVAAARAALERWGAGAGASRLVSGSMEPHLEAEHALARFFSVPSADGRFPGKLAALLFPTGYAANVGALQALVGPGDLVLSDERNHASLIDGCRLSRAEVRVYRHADPEHLDALLRAHRAGARAALVVTDGLFSMDGDRAPVVALREVCDRWDAGLLVDEAHALGVLGPRGRGVCAEAGVWPDALVGTLGKAFGLAGAFVAGSTELVRLLENRARSYVFSTAALPALAGAVPTALALADRAEAERSRVRAYAARLRAQLAALGYSVLPGDSPIVPVIVGAPEAAMRASARLLELGVFVQGIRPPAVPPGTARLRVVPTASHGPDHIEHALAAFERLAREAPP